MNLLDGERILSELKAVRLTITTHRIRFERNIGDVHQIDSIMLEHLSFCRIRSTVQSAWLVLSIVSAAIFVTLFFIPKVQGVSFIFLLVAAILLSFWATSKKTVLRFASPAGVIEVQVKKMGKEEATQVIDIVDQAKNYRYLYVIPRREAMRQAVASSV